MHEAGKIEKLYTIAEVVEITGFSDSTIWAKIKAGGFPRPLKLGLRAVRWPESVLVDWQSSLGIGGGEVKPRGERGRFVKRTPAAVVEQEAAQSPVELERTPAAAVLQCRTIPPPPEEPAQTETPVISKPKGKRGRPPKVRGSVESAAV